MDITVKKVIIIGTPFSILIISIYISTLLNHILTSPMDKDWVTRQFLIGMFMFAGLTIIPRLLHFQLFFSGVIPSFKINLSHHSPSLQSEHEFRLGNQSVCSGCMGSILSIIIAELLFLAYFIKPSWFSQTFTIWFFLIGLIAILISYSRYFILLKPIIRLIQHASLFIGVSLAIIACDTTFNSAFSMILLLPSWVLFLIGRLKLGEMDHRSIL
ncbi:MAG: hypothetical protein ACFFFH_19735 [Candidatus Thorarchaeota archaeon]